MANQNNGVALSAELKADLTNASEKAVSKLNQDGILSITLMLLAAGVAIFFFKYYFDYKKVDKLNERLYDLERQKLENKLNKQRKRNARKLQKGSKW